MTVRVARRTGAQAFRQGAPILDLDFAGGAGLPAGSFSRAGAGYAPTSGGVLVPFASGVPRRTDRGLLPEGSRTNKVAIFNAIPTDFSGVTKSGDAAATLTLVDDTAALSAAGLSLIAPSGLVYRLDNSAGVASADVTIAGVPGNLNPHFVSVYVRGSGTFFYGLNQGGSIDTGGQVATSGYARVSKAVTPANITVTNRVRAQPGAVVYFLLSQLEEGVSVSSPVVVAGSAATRGADSAMPTGLSLGSTFTIIVRAMAPAHVQAFARLLELSDGSVNNTISIQRNAASARLFVQNAGVTVASFNHGAWSGGTRGTMAVRVRPGSVAASFNGQAVISTALAVPPLDRASIGSAANASGHWDDFVERVRILPGDVSDAQLQALQA